MATASKRFKTRCRRPLFRSSSGRSSTSRYSSLTASETHGNTRPEATRSRVLGINGTENRVKVTRVVQTDLSKPPIELKTTQT